MGHDQFEKSSGLFVGNQGMIHIHLLESWPLVLGLFDTNTNSGLQSRETFGWSGEYPAAMCELDDPRNKLPACRGRC